MLLAYFLAVFEPRNLAVLVGSLLCAVAVVATVEPAYLPWQVNHVISKVIHLYLCWRYPINDSSGRHPMPTSPYTWPNGQGDIGKFLEGIENSISWEKTHGQIYRIWSGMQSEVVLTSPDHLQAVFKDSDTHTKAINNNSGYIMGELLGRCVGLVSGETWRSIREVTEVPFVHRKIPDHISAIKEHTERHFTELWKQKHLSQGQLHPAQDFKMLPFWIVAEVFYGKLTPELTEELKSLIPLREELFNYVIQGGLSRFSWTHFFPTKAGRALAEFKKRWESFNRAAYMHARDCKSNSTETHAPILSMYDAVSDDKITQDQLSQTIDESLFANLDVTIGGISWNPVFLAAYPTHQQRLRDEIRSLAPEDVDAYLQSSSTFLSACISESSRLKPLAAFSVPQSAPSDRVVGGYLIPAGTNFIVDSYALNVRNAFWGSEASTYRPDRFLEPKMRGLQLRYHFWRFGFGPRQCMGKYVADLIIRTLLVHLVKHFELSLEKEGEDGVWARSDSWITHPDFLIRCKEIKDTGEKAEVVG